MLVDQPTAAPTRKMWAVILAAFLVNGLIGTAEYFFPDLTGLLPATEWIDALAMIMAGYFVRERIS